MEKLAKVKREEFEREEAALVPLRHYLMAHVVPTLTKGLIDVTRARPEDPVEYLVRFLKLHMPFISFKQFRLQSSHVQFIDFRVLG